MEAPSRTRAAPEPGRVVPWTTHCQTPRGRLLVKVTVVVAEVPGDTVTGVTVAVSPDSTPTVADVAGSTWVPLRPGCRYLTSAVRLADVP